MSEMKTYRFTRPELYVGQGDLLHRQGHYVEAKNLEEAVAEIETRHLDTHFHVQLWKEEAPTIKDEWNTNVWLVLKTKAGWTAYDMAEESKFAIRHLWAIDMD
jgi:hypothetical protein